MGLSEGTEVRIKTVNIIDSFDSCQNYNADTNLQRIIFLGRNGCNYERKHYMLFTWSTHNGSAFDKIFILILRKYRTSQELQIRMDFADNPQDGILCLSICQIYVVTPF